MRQLADEKLEQRKIDKYIGVLLSVKQTYN